MRFDHVIVAAADLAADAAAVGRRLGLEVAPGGRHDGLGTENMIIPLHEGFVEVLALADADEAQQSEAGRLLAARVAAAAGGLLGWVLRVPDAAAVAARLGIGTVTVGRGGRTALLAGFSEALREPSLPFFIERPDTPPPAGAGPRLEAPRPTAGPGIEWVEVAGDAERLSAWLGEPLPPSVRLTAGEPALLRAGIGGCVLP
jgi:Glyoxalase-like domain